MTDGGAEPGTEEDQPARPGLHSAILAAHDAAVARGDAGYVDPFSGLFTFTARFLTDRGTCCGRGCRHCPFR